MSHAFEIERQKTLSHIAAELSEIDNLRGKSQIVINMIGKLSYAKSIHTYALDKELRQYRIVSSWYESDIYMHNCTDYTHSVFCDDIPAELYAQLITGEAIIGVNTLFPVTNLPWVESSIIYGFTVNEEVTGIMIYDTDDAMKWDEMTIEWLSTILSMLTSAVRRTIIYEKLGKQLAWRDKVYPIIAHDLRGGIGTVKMLAENALQLETMEDIREFMNMISKTSEETFLLLDNLLKWSRNNSIKIKPTKENVEIVSMIGSIVSYFVNSANTKGIELRFITGLERYHIEIDKEMIHTVVRNLISNSLKFTPTGGEIEVGCQEVGDKLEIWVRDSGVGMSDEIIRTLTSGDKHLTTYGTSGEKGSGLGFSLVREFLAAHDSRIEITSEQGNGSLFRFKI